MDKTQIDSNTLRSIFPLQPKHFILFESTYSSAPSCIFAIFELLLNLPHSSLPHEGRIWTSFCVDLIHYAYWLFVPFLFLQNISIFFGLNTYGSKNPFPNFEPECSYVRLLHIHPNTPQSFSSFQSGLCLAFQGVLEVCLYDYGNGRFL